MKEYIERFLERHFQTDWKSCTDEQLYQALLSMTQEKTQQLPKRDEKGRKLYYLSAEFLVGRLLGNNLLNLGLYEQVDNLLQSQGRSLAAIEELEAEPSLGNGGLGRLAACFLDSIATLGLYGEGVGLAYHFGLFRQRFEQNQQKEYPDRWRKPGDWMHRTEVCYPVQIGEQQVTARMYEVDVTGYQAPERTVLKLFDLEQTEEELVEQGIDFDKTDVCRNLTLFLYPDDSDREGVPAVFSGQCSSTDDSGGDAGARLFLRRTGPGSGHPDQRYSPDHDYPGADSTAGAARNGF